MSDIIKIRAISPLEKVYDEDKITQQEFKRFSMLKDEKKSFQVAVETDGKCEVEIAVNSDLEGVSLYTVKHIKSKLPMWKKDIDDYYRYSKSGYYPDLLLPVDGGKTTLEEGVTVIWVEVDAKGNSIGEHSVEIKVGDKTVSVETEIIDAELDFSDFIYTSWFHTDCLMSYYKYDVFSDEYWRVTENFLRTAREYGMNCVLTPIFTPPLDTEKGKERPTVQLIDIELNNGKYSFNFDKLTKWIEMAHRCNVEYFELAHFYTQWGARHAPKIMATVDGEYKRIFGWDTKANSKEYKEFLYALSVELKKYLEDRNLKDKVLIHVSDEPNFSMIFNYGKASKYIHQLFKGYTIVDALSDYKFYKFGIVSTPIPANDHIDKFIGNVNNLWVYYCSAQRKNFVSNRFFCNCSLRTRILGYQMFKYDIKGFLQWGYNFYYTQLSKALINPFEDSDAGGKFPSGDSFVVYPADDGTAYHSIRLKVFYDALQDMAALKTLSKLAGKDKCLAIIEENGKHDITFSNYPHDENWMLDTRESINKAIKANLK